MRPKGRPHVIAPGERMSSAYAQPRQEPKVPRNILLRPLDLPPMVPIKDQPDDEEGFKRLLRAVGSVE